MSAPAPPPPRPLGAADFDESLADAVDELPAWAQDALGDAVIRVEMRPPLLTHLSGVRRVNGHGPARITLYREPLLSFARSHDELRRLVRAELVRAMVRHLDLDPSQAVELAAAAERQTLPPQNDAAGALADGEDARCDRSSA